MAAPNKARRKVLAAKNEANKDGSYPTDTRGRAGAAKSRASEAVHKGRMSTAEEKRIDARADRKLGKKGKKR
jgi:hypothetical protein